MTRLDAISLDGVRRTSSDLVLEQERRRGEQVHVRREDDTRKEFFQAAHSEAVIASLTSHMKSLTEHPCASFFPDANAARKVSIAQQSQRGGAGPQAAPQERGDLATHCL